MKKNSGNVFYILAILFLLISAFIGFNNYQSLAQSASDYGVALGDQWVAVLVSVISSSFGFLGFSFLFYGIGMVLGRIDDIQQSNTTTKKHK